MEQDKNYFYQNGCWKGFLGKNLDFTQNVSLYESKKTSVRTANCCVYKILQQTYYTWRRAQCTNNALVMRS